MLQSLLCNINKYVDINLYKGSRDFGAQNPIKILT
jgi:hypothetical protein